MSPQVRATGGRSTLCRVTPPVPLPDKLDVQSEPGRRTVRFRFSPAAPLGGLAFWLAVPFVLWAYEWFQRGQASLPEALPLPFVLLYLLPVPFLAYLVLANWKNTTSVTAADGRLEVRHGPLPVPWRRRLDLAWREVTQLSCRAYDTTEDGERFYAVDAKLEGGKREVVLVWGLETLEQARFIADHLGRFLDLERLPEAEGAGVPKDRVRG